jgi:hypothetical protein
VAAESTDPISPRIGVALAFMDRLVAVSGPLGRWRSKLSGCSRRAARIKSGRAQAQPEPPSGVGRKSGG